MKIYCLLITGIYLDKGGSKIITDHKSW